MPIMKKHAQAIKRRVREVPEDIKSALAALAVLPDGENVDEWDGALEEAEEHLDKALACILEARGYIDRWVDR